MKRKAVPEYFSIYMDALRFLAAYFVLLFHLKKLKIGPDFVLGFIPDRGHDAVVLFFVLSGYVIAATSDRKKAFGWQEYFLDRAARVYSVALPTLVLCAAIAVFISAFTDSEGLLQALSGLFFSSLINFVFLGQSWRLEEWVAYNQPYWSLCYEVMYYALFGVAVFVKGWGRWLGLLLVALLAGPKVLLLFPCWLLGVVAYHWRDKWQLSWKIAIVVGFVIPSVFLVLLNKLGFGPTVRQFLDEIFVNRKDTLEFSADFLIDYVTAIFVAINLYAARFLPLQFLQFLTSLFRNGAAMSFTLYLMHMPIIYLIINFVGEGRHTVPWFFAAALGVPLICLGISQFTEYKRVNVRNWLSRHIFG
jgi:peptidoglycan/LPS O-acetylase OafA/YrhL